MTGFTFKPTGRPTDNGLAQAIDQKLREERRASREEALIERERAKKKRRYRMLGRIMACSDPRQLSGLSKRASKELRAKENNKAKGKRCPS